jgi:hypothetical protein
MASLLDLNLSYYTVGILAHSRPKTHLVSQLTTLKIPAAFLVAFLPHAYASILAGKNYDLAKSVSSPSLPLTYLA